MVPLSQYCRILASVVNLGSDVGNEQIQEEFIKQI